MMPLVSIIIPAYNAEQYLGDALKSCLAQTHPDIEILVIDDGSTDNTRQIANRYPEVIYLHQKNAGPAAARNQGIQKAKGEFLQFLDADDVLLPNKITRCLSIFETAPEVGLVYTDYEYRSKDLQSQLNITGRKAIFLPPEQILLHLLTTGSSLFSPHCALLRTIEAKAVNGFDEDLIITEDWHFWVKLAAAGTIFRYLDESLVWYRQTPDSISSHDLNLSRMRLKAYQHLRKVRLPKEVDLEERIAGRHHALAMKLWEQGQRAEARRQFRLALKTHSKGRLARNLLLYATYLMPADRAEKLLDLGKWLRG